VEHEDAGSSEPDAGGVSLATMQKWPSRGRRSRRGCWQDVELLESGVLGALRRLTVMLLHMRVTAGRAMIARLPACCCMYVHVAQGLVMA